MDPKLTIDDWIKIRNAKNEEAEIDIDGDIGDDFWGDGENTTRSIKAKLKEIANLKAKKITVNINSLGGSVAHGLGIHDALAQHNAQIITKINGLTASMATVIAQAGDTREMSDNALFLIHQPLMGIGWANVNQAEEVVQDLKTVKERLLNIYVKRSGKDRKAIEALMDENNGEGKWIDADEAKEIGLIDSVFEPTAAAASSNLPEPIALEKMKLPNLPTNYTEKMKEDTKKLSVVKGEAGEGTPSGGDDITNQNEEKVLKGMLTFIREVFGGTKQPKNAEEPKAEEPIEDPKAEDPKEDPKAGEEPKEEPKEDPQAKAQEPKEEPKDEEKEKLEARIKELEAANAKYEGQLAKKAAPSTGKQISGPEGLEGDSNLQDKETRSLLSDLKKLQGTWNAEETE